MEAAPAADIASCRRYQSELVAGWQMDLLWLEPERELPGMEDAGSVERQSQVTQKGGFVALESADGKFVYYMKGA